jgi:hypothetical protein
MLPPSGQPQRRRIAQVTWQLHTLLFSWSKSATNWIKWIEAQMAGRRFSTSSEVRLQQSWTVSFHLIECNGTKAGIIGIVSLIKRQSNDRSCNEPVTSGLEPDNRRHGSPMFETDWPTVRRTETAECARRRVGPATVPVPGSFHIFQNAVIQQARRLAYLDIFWCLTLVGF